MKLLMITLLPHGAILMLQQEIWFTLFVIVVYLFVFVFFARIERGFFDGFVGRSRECPWLSVWVNENEIF